MNVEYINPFIEASRSVFSQTNNIDMVLGKVRLNNTSLRHESLVTIIGLTGALRGQTFLIFSPEAALFLASKMMGMTVHALDEMSKSALSELTNIILGNTATIFSKRGMVIDITPPSFVSGYNMTVSLANLTILSVPMVLDRRYSIEMALTIV